MVRIYLPYVANLIESLGALSNLVPNEEGSDQFFKLYAARQALQAFLFESIWSHSLRVCSKPGRDLLDHLVSATSDDAAKPLDVLTIFHITTAVGSFRTVLEAEFQTSAVYLVTPRRGYDIPTLLDNAEIIFPAELMEKVPDVLFDLREAGKCIAFDLGTSAGFHLARALETVIVSYWDVVMSGKPLPKNRNLGQYITQMEQAGAGDAKVLTALKQIKDHHRNDLMHPEDRLDLDQAIAMLGIVQSAVVSMLPVLPKKPQVTT